MTEENGKDVELPGDDPEIEIVDDTPESDRGKPVRKKDDSVALPTDDEVEKYGSRAKDRINQLTLEFNKERRAREKAERLAGEAATRLRSTYEENRQFRTILSQGEKDLLENAKARHEAEFEAARREYAAAFDSNDSEKIAAAQARMSEAAANKARWSDYKPRYQAQEAQQQVQQQYVPQQQREQAPQSDPEDTNRLMEWRGKNRWFNADEDRTSYALDAHKVIVQSGIRPSSPEYFDRLDDAMARYTPSDEGSRQSQSSRPAPNGPAPVARTQTGSRKRIRLTQSQVDLAARLGISPQQYAAELMKEQEG